MHVRGCPSIRLCRISCPREPRKLPRVDVWVKAPVSTLLIPSLLLDVCENGNPPAARSCTRTSQTCLWCTKFAILMTRTLQPAAAAALRPRLLNLAFHPHINGSKAPRASYTVRRAWWIRIQMLRTSLAHGLMDGPARGQRCAATALSL